LDFKNVIVRLGMVVHVYNPIPQKQRQEDCELQASMGYIARPCLEKENVIAKFTGE
jgi:hypothetical protein